MLNNIRIEEDLLGTREVPADAYYGVHTLRAIENFYISNSKISDIPEFVRGMVMVKKAAAMANKELQTIPKNIANTIIAACDEVLNKGKCMDQFPVDVYQGGAGTSVNMNTNEVLANIGLELMGHQKGEYQSLNPNDHVNKCQSTNDAYPTGFRIAVYASVVKLVDAINQLGEGFQNKAVEFQDILKMGRTQLQDAVPMTLGQEFHAFNVLLNEETRNLMRTSELLLEVNLGATAIGTRLNTPDGYQQLAVQKLAEVSNLAVVPAEDLIEATSDCGAYVMVHSALKRLAVKLSKICNDLRLLSSGPRAGLNEINLPELQAGSSIMPAKVNPVVPEVVNQVCCYNLLEKCINGITANKAVCESYVYNSIGIVTYLNPFIGHHNGDIVGKICAETGKSVREVVLERGLLTEAELDDIFSAQNLMHPAYKAKRYTDESEQ